MIVTPIKTKKVVVGDDLFKILDEALPELKENSVVAVSSKIVGICEGRVDPDISNENRDKVAMREAELYVPRQFNQMGFMITINNHTLVASAGVDHSNGNGFLVMWPKDPQESANKIREYLAKKHGIKNVGVIITDSHLTPLRYGVTGTAIAHSGFEAIKNYVGTPDVFGRLLQVETSNIPDSLASSSVVVMGEGNEQQPIAIIEDIPFVNFQQRNPTEEELEKFHIALGADVYSTFLANADWKKGGKYNYKFLDLVRAAI